MATGRYWVTFMEALSPLLYWFKTDRYATVRWKNISVANAVQRHYGVSARNIKNKILTYYDKVRISVSVFFLYIFTIVVFSAIADLRKLFFVER